MISSKSQCGTTGKCNRTFLRVKSNTTEIIIQVMSSAFGDLVVSIVNKCLCSVLGTERDKSAPALIIMDASLTVRKTNKNKARIQSDK